MKNYPKALKRKLLNTVSQIRKELPKHTADPKRDFKRNRKLPFETLCKTILFMSGQSLNVELQRQFHYDPTAATTSAFVQQRGKLLPTAFEEILRRFTYQNRPIRRWNGYTLLAADGSHVQIPSDIHDKATYFNSTKDGRGYNLLHLNALYDLESQVYLDAIIVPFPVSWTVKMKKKQKETQDILSYHSQAAGCSDKARAKASGGRQPIEECGRTGL